MSDEERLNAFLDRELDAAEMARLEAMAAADPRLQEQLRQMRARDELLRAGLDEQIGDEVPDRFLQAIDSGLAPASRDRPPSAANDNRWGWKVGGALAASLALGLLVGTQLPSRDAGSDPLGGVAAALGTTASGQTVRLASGDRLTPELTFPRRGGGWCRQFAVERATGRLAGVACRTDRWSIEALVPAGERGGEGYEVAGASTSPVLDELTSTLRSGDPVDAAEEKAILESGWARSAARNP